MGWECGLFSALDGGVRDSRFFFPFPLSLFFSFWVVGKGGITSSLCVRRADGWELMAGMGMGWREDGNGHVRHWSGLSDGAGSGLL